MQWERLGVASKARPPGPVVWFHALSLGETAVALPVVLRCLLEYSDAVSLLLTVAAPEAHALLEGSLPRRVMLQRAPLDNAAAVALFLRHWRPTVGVLMRRGGRWAQETPAQPALVEGAAAAGVPLALLNARLSSAAFLRWYRHRGARALLGRLVGRFALVVPQSDIDVGRFRMAGATLRQMPGWCSDLKYAAALGTSVWHLWRPSAERIARLRAALAGRPVWVAASTVAGEEEAVGRVHAGLRRQWPDLVTALAPRQAARCPEVAQALAGEGLRVVVWSAAAPAGAPVALPPGTDILLVDTLTDLPLMYSVCEVAFIGNSLAEGGRGHNLAEAAVAGCAVVVGDQAGPFNQMADELNQAAVLAAEEAAAAVHSSGPLEDAYAPPTSGGDAGGAPARGGPAHVHSGLDDRPPGGSAPPPGARPSTAPAAVAYSRERRQPFAAGGDGGRGAVRAAGTSATAGNSPQHSAAQQRRPTLLAVSDGGGDGAGAARLRAAASDAGAGAAPRAARAAAASSSSDDAAAAAAAPRESRGVSALRRAARHGSSAEGGSEWDHPYAPPPPTAATNTPNGGCGGDGSPSGSERGAAPGSPRRCAAASAGGGCCACGASGDGGGGGGGACCPSAAERPCRRVWQRGGQRPQQQAPPRPHPHQPSLLGPGVGLEVRTRVAAAPHPPPDAPPGAWPHDTPRRAAPLSSGGASPCLAALPLSRCTSTPHPTPADSANTAGGRSPLVGSAAATPTGTALSRLPAWAGAAWGTAPLARADSADGEGSGSHWRHAGGWWWEGPGTRSPSAPVTPAAADGEASDVERGGGAQPADGASGAGDAGHLRHAPLGRAPTLAQLLRRSGSDADPPGGDSSPGSASAAGGDTALRAPAPAGGGSLAQPPLDLGAACAASAAGSAWDVRDGARAGSTGWEGWVEPPAVGSGAPSLDDGASCDCAPPAAAARAAIAPLRSVRTRGGGGSGGSSPTAGAPKPRADASPRAEVARPPPPELVQGPGHLLVTRPAHALSRGSLDEEGGPADGGPTPHGGCSAVDLLPLTEHSGGHSPTSASGYSPTASYATQGATPSWVSATPWAATSAASDAAATRAPWRAPQPFTPRLPAHDEIPLGGDVLGGGQGDGRLHAPPGAASGWLASSSGGLPPVVSSSSASRAALGTGYMRYHAEYILPATHLPCAPHGPAVWRVAGEKGLAHAVGTLMREPLERRSRGHAAAQAAAKLASGLVSTVWHVLDDVVVAPALAGFIAAQSEAQCNGAPDGLRRVL